LLKTRKPKRYREKKESIEQPAVKEIESKKSTSKVDSPSFKAILKNVQEILGDSEEVEEFTRINSAEGVDRIVDMWFN